MDARSDSKKAEFGSSEAGALGGAARAESLTAEERRSIARAAAEQRWSAAGKSPLPRATHGSIDHPLRIGKLELECYVLSDGTRVLSQAGFLEALGRHRKASVKREEGEEQVPPILQGKTISPYISREILLKSRPIQFRTPSGATASGYRAELLPEVCEIYLRARDDGKLLPSQEHLAKHAEIMIRALAHVGIIALVDEATGYQQDRARNALAKILEAFVAKEIQKWVKTFPADYYRELFRLWELPYDPERPQWKRPSFFGTLTNNIVYSRLAPGVLSELKRRNPTRETGIRERKHHQHLTRDIGHPKLLEHLAAVIALMRASRHKDDFMAMLDRALPKHVDMPLFESKTPDQKSLRLSGEVSNPPQSE